jgi:hypothetical protein
LYKVHLAYPREETTGAPIKPLEAWREANAASKSFSLRGPVLEGVSLFEFELLDDLDDLKDQRDDLDVFDALEDDEWAEGTGASGVEPNP